MCLVRQSSGCRGGFRRHSLFQLKNLRRGVLVLAFCQLLIQLRNLRRARVDSAVAGMLAIGQLLLAAFEHARHFLVGGVEQFVFLQLGSQLGLRRFKFMSPIRNGFGVVLICIGQRTFTFALDGSSWPPRTAPMLATRLDVVGPRSSRFAVARSDPANACSAACEFRAASSACCRLAFDFQNQLMRIPFYLAPRRVEHSDARNRAIPN